MIYALDLAIWPHVYLVFYDFASSYFVPAFFLFIAPIWRNEGWGSDGRCRPYTGCSCCIFYGLSLSSAISFRGLYVWLTLFLSFLPHPNETKYPCNERMYYSCSATQILKYQWCWLEWWFWLANSALINLYSQSKSIKSYFLGSFLLLAIPLESVSEARSLMLIPRAVNWIIVPYLG